MGLCVGLEAVGVHVAIKMNRQSWNAEDWAINANLCAWENQSTLVPCCRRQFLGDWVGESKPHQLGRHHAFASDEDAARHAQVAVEPANPTECQA
jgi:hypothetical protein